MSHKNKNIWQFQKPKDFTKQVLALPKPVRHNLTRAMTLLAECPIPLIYGEKKITKYGVFYAMQLSSSHRLAFDILDNEKKILRIIRVGDHRFVYGKD
ncbi:MAG: hypothetical protein L0H55_05595 [Candidatus Nitrosocosmicus sp.]|nr:hypothetical protein [Candidatus Nitrosocosmicus sp.]